MSRVSKEVVLSVTKEISDLPEEIVTKCGLCGDTLTHFVKSIEVKSGAGTKTVCDIFTKIYNSRVPDLDRVKPSSFHNKVLRKEGKKSKLSKGNNKKEQPKNDFSTPSAKYTNDRKEAIDALHLGNFLNLSEFHGWPEEILSIIKKIKSKDYHPDTGGSDEKYQQFMLYIENLRKGRG